MDLNGRWISRGPNRARQTMPPAGWKPAGGARRVRAAAEPRDRTAAVSGGVLRDLRTLGGMTGNHGHLLRLDDASRCRIRNLLREQTPRHC
jgi:hypothetical protein